MHDSIILLTFISHEVDNFTHTHIYVVIKKINKIVNYKQLRTIIISLNCHWQHEISEVYTMRVIAKRQHYQKIINHSNLDQSRNPYIDTTEITNLSNLESKTNRRYIFLKYHVGVYKLIACMKFHLSLRKPSWLETCW